LAITDIPGFVALRDRLITAFMAFDSSEANRVMEEALALYAPETVAIDIIQPALIELGQRWEGGEICVAMEHFGTSFCMRKLSAMFNAAQPESGESTVLVSCVEGELHEIGLMILALMLARSGFRVIYLGANMPGSELVEAVQRTSPDAIVLSAPSRTAVVSLRTAVQTLHSTFSPDSGILIGYGGAIFEQSPDLRQTVDAVYLGKDARTARDILQRALRSPVEGLALTTQ
jgi:methanogenic corrinoid protein MtbC1